MTVSNRKIIETLREFAHIHELTGETFKLRSYQRAVKTLQGIDEPIAELSTKELMELEGIGKSIAAKIKELNETGEVASLTKLREKTPSGLREVMSIEGVGPKTAKMLYEKLGIDSVDKLEDAINQQELQELKGIGPKTVENMRDGIDRFRRTSGRFLRAQVQPVANSIVDKLKTQFSSISDISVAGSLRRKKETIGDIDILVKNPESKPIMDYFTTMPDVERILSSGDKKSSVIVEGDIQIDIRVIEGSSYYSHLQYFTGSKEHNIRVRQLAIDQGYLLNEYGLFKDEEPAPLESEKTIYEILGMEYAVPELREDRGEIEAALENKLPQLVGYSDIKGDLHVHSRPDDPSLRESSHNMEKMVEAAIEVGHDYIVFTDHTQDLAMVFGYNDEEMLDQIEQVRDLNQKYNEIELFIGAELNIRPDGTVDLEEETLDQLDFCIASVHSNFKMEEKEMTERIKQAMEYKQVKSIAHPTTREFKRRDPIPLNFDELVDQALKTDTSFEINGAPERMDLPDQIIHRYKDSGAKFTLGSDAHLHYQLGNITYATDQARRGWLTKDKIINTYDLDEFRQLL